MEYQEIQGRSFKVPNFKEFKECSEEETMQSQSKWSKTAENLGK